MNTPLCFLGSGLVQNEYKLGLIKYDSEGADRNLSGVSGLGVSVLAGASRGIFKTTDYRRSPDGRLIKDLALGVATTFEEYFCPAATPAPFVIEAGEHGPGIAPKVAEEVVNARIVCPVQKISLRVVIPEVVRDAFSYTEDTKCLVIIVKTVVHAWRVYSKAASPAKCVRTGQRHAAKSS